MALGYFIVYFVVYGLPLVASAVLVLVLSRTVFKGRLWRFPAAAVSVGAASCVPWLIDRVELSRDFAAYAPDVIYPDSLTLEAGSLWRLEEGNHAGITCGYVCAYTDLAFVNDVEVADAGSSLRLGSSGAPVDTHDLWAGLYERTLTDGEAFPFAYAYISIPVYQDYGVPQSGNYRKAHWPEDGKGVHMLVRLPRDGQLDFATAEVLYRRYNMQTDVALPFFWGVATETVQKPSSFDIFNDLVRISARQ